MLETARRAVAIRGESLLSTYHHLGAGSGSGLTLQQAIVRYTFDGESANGMLERSTPIEHMA